jgi:multiple sugar transport system substrate-binding protein
MANQDLTRTAVDDYVAGRISRRGFLRRATLLGISAPFAAQLLAACSENGASTTTTGASATTTGAVATTEGTAGTTTTTVATRDLTVAFHEAHLSRYPFLDQFASDLAEGFPFSLQQAPVEGFGAGAFIAETAHEESTWDAYTSMTPFIEMEQLVRAGAIVPWDDYVSSDVLADILPQAREESSIDGKLYNFPWVIDLVVGVGNAGVLERAGLDPTSLPTTWDEWVDNARQVMTSGAAPFGAAFDGSGWRSIAPIAHSISTDIYREDGLIDWTHDAVVEALEILRRIYEVSAPFILDPGAAHGGFGGTPDRGIWAAEDAGYYLQFTNAPITLAGNWVDPSQQILGPIPSVPGGEGSSVFWSTGAALFTFGENKERAGEMMDALTSDERMWRAAAGTENPIGQLPARRSVWESWEQQRPDWLSDWALNLRDAFERARPIKSHSLGFGFTQFLRARPFWESYLTGDEPDARTALQNAMDDVLAEVDAAGG